MRIIITGDRNWADEDGIESVLEMLPNTSIIVHGACRGADTVAGKVAKKLGFEVEEWLADWEVEGRSAGPQRNQRMLDSGCDLVVAFHYNLHKSKGTKDMVGRAVKAGIPVIYYPFWQDPEEDF